MPLSLSRRLFLFGRNIMNHKRNIVLCLAMLTLVIGAGSATAQDTTPAAPIGSVFTYQGRLTDAGSPADGVYDLRFILYDASVGGSQVGSTLTIDDQPVNQGYFTVTLDFGASVFDGQSRWLEIAVRSRGNAGEYTTLSPRQALTAAPYALFSQAAPWNGLSGVPAGFADGVDDTWSAHNHLGETWTGSDNPLVITGTFGAPYTSTLLLGNSSGNALYIPRAAKAGVQVHMAGTPSHAKPPDWGGIWNNNGFQVDGAEGNGLYVGFAGNGVFVDLADHAGVRVMRAVGTGFDVDSAGIGVVVGSTSGNGILVDSAGYTGVSVVSMG
jgi:hypothetical protein